MAKRNRKSINAAWMVVYTEMCEKRATQETAERLERIALIDPQQIESHLCVGIALGLRGKFREGLEELERGILLGRVRKDVVDWRHETST